jgi:hypothetical protein
LIIIANNCHCNLLYKPRINTKKKHISFFVSLCLSCKLSNSAQTLKTIKTKQNKIKTKKKQAKKKC